MTELLSTLQRNSQNFLSERPTLASTQHDPLTILYLALEEMHELEQATTREEVVSEFTDVFNYLAQLALFYQITEDEIKDVSRYKYTIRNHIKYPPEDDGIVSQQNQRAFYELREKIGNGNDYF